MPRSASLLLDWYAYRDKCFASFDVEESDGRVGILEEYLHGLLMCLKERNQSRDELIAKQISSFLADEREERRFIEEDADFLAHKTFITVTQRAIAATVAMLEKEARNAIEEEYVHFALGATQVAEELGRKAIGTELLDSIFLKLCQTQPQWMWRRLDDLVGKKNAVLNAACARVSQEEATARSQIDLEYVEYMADCGTALATAEKQVLFGEWTLPDKPTARKMLEDSSTKIQSVFRGWRVRKEYRMLQAC